MKKKRMSKQQSYLLGLGIVILIIAIVLLSGQESDTGCGGIEVEGEQYYCSTPDGVCPAAFGADCRTCPDPDPAYLIFFLKEEEGIGEVAVTGVQTCALPIYLSSCPGQKDRFLPLS